MLMAMFGTQPSATLGDFQLNQLVMDLLSEWRMNEKETRLPTFQHLRDIRDRAGDSFRYLIHGVYPVTVLKFEDLQDLSGFKQRIKVRDWLRKNNIPFVIDAQDNPVTTVDIMERAIAEKPSQTASEAF